MPESTSQEFAGEMMEKAGQAFTEDGKVGKQFTEDGKVGAPLYFEPTS